MYFEYGETEINYLRQKDRRLCEVIDRIGHIERAVDADLFSSVVHHIIGQQISTKAQATIWQRMQDVLGEVNAETILSTGVSELQALVGQQRREGPRGRSAVGVSPPDSGPQAVREIPPPLQPLLQRCKPVSVGSLGRRYPRNERL